MNKTEKAIIQGVKNALGAVSGPLKDDDWEVYGQRMQATIQSNVRVLDGLLTIEATEDKEEGVSLS